MAERDDVFPQTRWSLILLASEKDEVVARRALGELCQMYWKPVYTYIRGRGWNLEDAEDLTQEFFARFLEKKKLETAEAEKGKLRAYLLAMVKRFLVDEARLRGARKRGGGSEVISIDDDSVEQQFSELSEVNETPEMLYERAWARTLISEIVGKLEGQYAERGRDKEFSALKPSLLKEEDVLSQRELGWELGLSLAAVKVAIFRLRQRFRELLEKEIAQTVEGNEELLAEEVRWLMGIWKSS